MATATPLCLSFTTIPQELIEHILQFCEPTDLARLAATCRHLHDIVYNGDDQAVWRVAFLSYPFDDPRRSLAKAHASNADIDWRAETQQRVEAQKLMSADMDSAESSSSGSLDKPAVSLGEDDEDGPLRRALQRLISVVGNAPQGDDKPSADLAWVQNTLLASPVFQAVDRLYLTGHEQEWANPDCTRQLVCRLQSCLALSHQHDAAQLRLLRTASRTAVYDLRRYQSETFWGPYNLDARRRLRVNWEHVKHIQNVVLMNLRTSADSWGQVWPEWGIESTRPYSAPNVRNRKPWDWAGVEGKWRRVVCFMDYRDLFTFNFSSLNAGPRNPNFFDDEFSEAVRLMEVDLQVVDPPDSSSPASSPSSSSSSNSSLFSSTDSTGAEEWDPKYPPIHFTGSSRGVHSGTSKIRGTVRMMREGAVRWNFILGVWGDQVTSYDDATNRWRFSAEAVQVGNVGSAMGIAGVWTVAVHDEGDPAGPFWMWKAADGLPKDLDLHLNW